jgi:hypothetical protein
MAVDNDVLISNKFIYNLQYVFVRWFRLITALVVILYIVGFFTKVPVGYNEAKFVFEFLIALFLLYRFNSYRKKIVLTELDKEVAFSAGEYLLIISLVDVLAGYEDQIRPKLMKYTQPVVDYFKSTFGV